MLIRQVLSGTTTSESNSGVIITRTIMPKIASDCQTQLDLFLIFHLFQKPTYQREKAQSNMTIMFFIYPVNRQVAAGLLEQLSFVLGETSHVPKLLQSFPHISRHMFDTSEGFSIWKNHL